MDQPTPECTAQVEQVNEAQVGQNMGQGASNDRISKLSSLLVPSASVYRLERELNEKIDAIEVRIMDSEVKLDMMMEQIGGLNQEISNLRNGGNAENTNEPLNDGIDKNEEILNNLIMEKDVLAEQIDVALKDIEALKEEKVDRLTVEEMMADKADYSVVRNKVSIQQFDATKEDLTRDIEEIIERLTNKELEWHQALAEIDEIIQIKLDKDDLQPLREEIHAKLKALQHKLMELSKMKDEAKEAAGAKSKFLHDLNCISCDKDVVMKKYEQPPVPRPKPITNTRAVKPILLNELESVRKELGSQSFNKNLHFMESSLRQQPHLVKRYCGGSHTILSRNRPFSSGPRMTSADVYKTREIHPENPCYIVHFD
jgi:hypothetical protein